MATAADIIKRSMKLLGVLAAGESPSAAEASDGLVELNLLLDSWANERLLVYCVRRTTYTLTPGLSPHTIGVGGTFNATQPTRVEMASVILPGTTTEVPLDILTDAEYRDIGDKTVTSTLPRQLWIEETYPQANLWLWPIPSTAATFVLYAWNRLASFAASDTVTLPPGYENALGHALALQWAPQFGVEPSPRLMESAADALTSIKLANQPDEVSDLDAGLLSRSTFNIFTG